MTDPQETGSEQLRRLPDGKIAAPPRYVEYDGQVIVRERYSTHQRWTTTGSHDSKKGDPPSILHSRYCRDEDEVLKPKNDHLDVSEIEVYYVDDSESVVYEVAEDDEPEIRADGGQPASGSDRPGWVCTGCGKHVTGTIPVDVCADCGGEWIEATPDRLACEGCGSDDASRVLNSEYNRLCGQCVKIDNSVPARVLGEFAYQLEGRGHENIADELSIIIEECKGLPDEDDEPEIVTDGGVDQSGTDREGLPWRMWLKCAAVGLVGGIVGGALVGVVL